MWAGTRPSHVAGQVGLCRGVPPLPLTTKAAQLTGPTRFPPYTWRVTPTASQGCGEAQTYDVSTENSLAPGCPGNLESAWGPA